MKKLLEILVNQLFDMGKHHDLLIGERIENRLQEHRNDNGLARAGRKGTDGISFEMPKIIPDAANTLGLI